ncbi:hypothetical protein [Blastococcus deserti]|uniref:IrrE N-terminal-like domain-containing protein n=1 Tax=Blastococcus deserti TaxID=2259033 RepID=A0ABW4XBR6_9ACTN
MPDGQAVGEARIALIGAARNVGRDLSTAGRLLERIQRPLYERIRIRIGTHLARAGRRADETLAEAERADTTAADVWAAVHALRWEVDELLEECLLLLSGSSDRAAKFDDGFCTLADALVDELVARTPMGHWSSFTVLGRDERYSRASRIIQLRFPRPSVWQLATVAHELGHFAGPALVNDQDLRTSNPLADIGEELGDGSPQSWAWLEELFADAFATRLLGPAYGFMCTLDAFDPLLARVPTESHPAPDQRVAVIASMLKRAGDDQMEWASDRITRLWAELVDAADGAAGREPVGDSPFCDALADLLVEVLPVSAYEGWTKADKIATDLLANKNPRADGIAMSDALNGAWLARQRSISARAVDEVAIKAEELCRQLTNLES